jgi:hypothetical protein
MVKGIFFVICGIVSVLGGIFGKDFYKADIETGVPYKQRSSTWSGRLVFIVVGVSFVALGIKFLL